MGATGLSRRDRAVLDFERGWWRSASTETKAEAIARELSMSSSRYYQLLGALMESDAALAYDPLVVRRLRRRRRERRRAALLGNPAPRRSDGR